MNESPKSNRFYDSTPYKDAFDIVYPQESFDGDIHKYRCKSCKIVTTEINGRLENHAPDCEYRLSRAARPI